MAIQRCSRAFRSVTIRVPLGFKDVSEVPGIAVAFQVFNWVSGDLRVLQKISASFQGLQDCSPGVSRGFRESQGWTRGFKEVLWAFSGVSGTLLGVSWASNVTWSFKDVPESLRSVPKVVKEYQGRSRGFQEFSWGFRCNTGAFRSSQGCSRGFMALQECSGELRTHQRFSNIPKALITVREVLMSFQGIAGAFQKGFSDIPSIQRKSLRKPLQIPLKSLMWNIPETLSRSTGNPG